MMLYINKTSTSITISQLGEATAFGSITGYQGITDEVWIYLYLERYVNGAWQTYNSWSLIRHYYCGSLLGEDIVPRGYYYRCAVHIMLVWHQL